MGFHTFMISVTRSVTHIQGMAMCSDREGKAARVWEFSVWDKLWVRCQSLSLVLGT